MGTKKSLAKKTKTVKQTKNQMQTLSPPPTVVAKTPHKHRRLWKWLIGIASGLVLLIIIAFIWFRLSPWPGAMLIRYVFDKGGAKTAASLEKHAPLGGITVFTDQQYKTGDKDAKLDVYVPDSAMASGQKLPVIIWTHGGAWLSGNKIDAAVYYKLLAQAGFTVVAPNYSLAPEHKYPTPVNQLNAVHAYVQTQADRFHADVNNIVLAGDSAGSQLSSQMAALITNPAYAKEVGIVPALKPDQLKGVVLNCGVFKMEELTYPNPALPKIIGWGEDVTVWAYSGTHNFSDPIIRQMSPYYHVTKDFPPAFITGGNADPLTDVQSKPLANKLKSLGVPTTTLFYPANHQPELPHEYQFNLDNADGQRALEQIIAFVRDRTQ